VHPLAAHSASEPETRRVGKEFAARLRAGDVVLLEGGLGAGKTVFARGLAEGLGVDPGEVRSPTFTLVNIYSGRMTLYHVDLYRIDKPEDLTELGLEEFLGTDGVAVVEWPEKLGPYLPARAFWVRIRDRGGEKREITFARGRLLRRGAATRR